jgi:hypothetical protein
MYCPACLQSSVVTEAVSQVGGTLFCGQHAVEALTRSMKPGPNLRFSPPASTPAPGQVITTPATPA